MNREVLERPLREDFYILTSHRLLSLALKILWGVESKVGRRYLCEQGKSGQVRKTFLKGRYMLVPRKPKHFPKAVVSKGFNPSRNARALLRHPLLLTRITLKHLCQSSLCVYALYLSAGTVVTVLLTISLKAGIVFVKG